MEVGLNIENKIAQLKQIEQQLQSIMSQHYQLELQASEVTHTLEALENVDDDTTIYNSVGAIMFKVTDHKKLKEDMEDNKETLEIKVKSLEKQENTLKATYDSLRGQIQSALQGPGASG